MRLSLKIRVAYFCRSIWNFVPNSELSRFLSLSDRHSSIRRHKTLVCDDDLMNFAGRASTLHTSRLTRARVWQYDTMTTTTCIARLPVRPSVSHFSRSVGRSSCAKRLNQRESMTPEGDLRRCSLLHGRRSLSHPATAAAAVPVVVVRPFKRSVGDWVWPLHVLGYEAPSYNVHPTLNMSFSSAFFRCSHAVPAG